MISSKIKLNHVNPAQIKGFSVNSSDETVDQSIGMFPLEYYKEKENQPENEDIKNYEDENPLFMWPTAQIREIANNTKNNSVERG